MRILSFFRLPIHRRFEYRPRYSKGFRGRGIFRGDSGVRGRFSTSRRFSPVPIFLWLGLVLFSVAYFFRGFFSGFFWWFLGVIFLLGFVLLWFKRRKHVG